MHVFQQINVLRNYLQQLRCQGLRIGFVPTMGALHAGHMQLVRQALAENDYVVCSIFVNPTQFNNPSDLANYPRDLEADLAMLRAAGCQVAFCPNEEEMYPRPALANVQFGPLEAVMEGAWRPGHFAGVGLVVSKLFNIVAPDVAYFGQKDLQQCRIVQQLANDLSFPLEIRCVETVREADGLALSSRNQRLSLEQRAEAPALYKALQAASEQISRGKSLQAAEQAVQAVLADYPGVALEYFMVVDGGTLQSVQDVAQHEQLALCIAAYVGEVRLIDNLLLSKVPQPKFDKFNA